MVKGISTITTLNGGDWIKPLIDPSEDDNKNDGLSHLNQFPGIRVKRVPASRAHKWV